MGTVLFTGLPGVLGAEFLQRILRRSEEVHAACIVQPKFATAARSRLAALETLEPAIRGRVRLVEGDICGTSVATGAVRAVVVATGMATEVGRIAALLQEAGREKTPLTRRLDEVGRQLLYACFGIVALVFILGLARSILPFELFLSAVSLAVAAIPKGLPAVVTIALALCVARMATRNALVRRLPAVETLGSAQVICTDKTGTLTVGQMTARRLVTAEGTFTVTGAGYSSDGEILLHGVPHVPARGTPLRALLECAAACVDAEVGARGAEPAVVVGDPTEAALVVAAAKAGIDRDAIERERPRLATVPFDSDHKRMTVVRRPGHKSVTPRPADGTTVAAIEGERTDDPETSPPRSSGSREADRAP